MRLLPRGRAWAQIADSEDTTQGLSLATLMPTWERLANSDAALLNDSFPSTTDLLLPEWQSSLGLPDPCAGAAPTLQQARGQVVARLTGRGHNQSIDYFTTFAQNLGFVVTITQFAPFRAGIARAGTPLYDNPWAFVWRVNIPSVAVTYFRAGRSLAGEPLAILQNSTLVCELGRLRQAHTTVIFNFGSA